MLTPTPLRLETLSPHHYQSLAIPSGVATYAAVMADRAVSYGLASTFGALIASPALPTKGYARDFASMTWLASAFVARDPSLMRPMGRRLTLEHEGGFQRSVQDATGTGNLKQWFFIQEVPAGKIYDGAVFGPDPFEIASRAASAPVEEIVIRVGRHRSGLVRLTRGGVREVRLNLHSAFVSGADIDAIEDMRVDIPALWDMQISNPIPLDRAGELLGSWQESARFQQKIAAA